MREGPPQSCLKPVLGLSSLDLFTILAEFVGGQENDPSEASHPCFPTWLASLPHCYFPPDELGPSPPKLTKICASSSNYPEPYGNGEACTITDLPGYGFARVSKDLQDDWRKQIEQYLRNRENLRLAVLFVDAGEELSVVVDAAADARLLAYVSTTNIA